jgi:biotin carboxyl carrier protein
MQVRLDYRTGERELSVEVGREGEGYRVEHDGRTLAVEVQGLSGSELEMKLDGRRHRCFVAARGDERFIFLAGQVYTLRRVLDQDEAAEEDLGAGPHVIAQMPCTIVKVLVAPDQEIEAGAGLLIVESMKMETEIAAPLRGRVAAIHVQAGQTVGHNAPLVDLEPTGEE